MEKEKTEREEKEPYVKPEVLASYQKEELEEVLQRDGQTPHAGCGCGSACGCA